MSIQMKTICHSFRFIQQIVIISLITTVYSCNNADNKATGETKTDSLTEEQKHLPQNALKGLTIAKGLEKKPVATGAILKNPTQNEKGEKGRVWVTEAY